MMSKAYEPLKIMKIKSIKVEKLGTSEIAQQTKAFASNVMAWV